MNPKYYPILLAILLLLIQVVPASSAPPPVDPRPLNPSVPPVNPINNSSEPLNLQVPYPSRPDSSIDSIKPAPIVQPVNPPQQLASDSTAVMSDPLPPIPPIGPDLGPLLDTLVFLFIALAVLVIAFYFLKNFFMGKQTSPEDVGSKTSATSSPINEELATAIKELLDEIRKLRKDIKELRDEMRE